MVVQKIRICVSGFGLVVWIRPNHLVCHVIQRNWLQYIVGTKKAVNIMYALPF